MANIQTSIQRVLSGDKPAVRKSLIIGVGGSGMKGVLSVKKWMESSLPNEAFRYLRYIGIDTTDIETSIEAKGAKYRFPSNQFFQEESRMLYIPAPTPAELSLDFLRDKYKNDPAFKWLPNPDVYDISTRAGQGANQTRPLGRLAFFYNESIIRETLIKERDRLASFSTNPKYFQLLDVKEEDRKEEEISFEIKKGVGKYYFKDKIAPGRQFISLDPDSTARAILAPQSDKPLTIDSFPLDENGYYFQVNPAHFVGQTFKFKTSHMRSSAQISIFITCSIVGGTGNGMILDLAAMVKDIFKDFWPTPRIYGILILPAAFQKVVYNRNARGNAYAALKEIDYFMSGNSFKATYPGGREVIVNDQIFDNGMLYLLDIENMASNSLQGRDQVQELTGQFISTFVASTVGGAIEERMVNDSTRVSVYLPKDETSKRKACYNSFGISRVVYPVDKMAQLGYKITAVKLIENFVKDITPKLLLETIGDLNRGLVRAIRLNCLSFFERLHPDYELDMGVEFKSYKTRLDGLLEKKDARGAVALLEMLGRDYGPEEQEKIKNNFLSRISKRSGLENEKLKNIITGEIHKYINDPMRGFLFAESVITLILDKLELYQKKYYNEKVALSRYSVEDFSKCIEACEKQGLANPEIFQQFITMQDFNYRQLVYESMLTAAENFVRDLKASLFEIKNNEIVILKEKLFELKKNLETEIQDGKFEILEKKNPLFFYLINPDEIDLFLKKYFYARLSIEDLSNEINFLKMDREDDAVQILTTHLIATRGLKILEKKQDEIMDILKSTYSHLLGKNAAEVKEALASEAQDDEDKLEVSDATQTKIEIENIRSKLFQIIYSKLQGFNFESISIKQVLEEKKITLKKLLEKLDVYSRPYIKIDSNGTDAMEYYRTVTNFPLNTYEEGDKVEDSQANDLPTRMDHYTKRSNASPDISVETFEAPTVCKPYEMISIGILLGYPIFKISSLSSSVNDYHALMAERSHPLHCFNHPLEDAKYFPDPMRTLNYLNPARLWNGLVAYGILVPGDNGYAYEDNLSLKLKEMQAKENYKGNILEIEKLILAEGGYEKISPKTFVQAIHTFAMLSKSKSGKICFRKDVANVIADILDGEETDAKAKEMGMNRDEYLTTHLAKPEFDGMEDLSKFLFKGDVKVKTFLINEIQNIIKRTKGNEEAGAAISLPKSKIQSVTLPTFKDQYKFYEYFEKFGSLEWQNILKNEIVSKLAAKLSSYEFRMDYDPTLLDRSKIQAFLEKEKVNLPEVTVWETAIENKIIK
ncbi:MAG: tubulin-like doman-containing protein [Leptospira sp.]|nr:tubulin-like doman-containing protein [Leptospira sp.]